MAANRSAIMLYFDTAEAVARLTDADCGKLFKAMLHYAMTGEIPTFDGVLEFAWAFIQPKIDADGDRYNRKVLSSKYAAYCREQKKHDRKELSFEDYLEQYELQ